MSSLKPFIAESRNNYRLENNVVSRDDIVRVAKILIGINLRKSSAVLSCPKDVRDYLHLHLGCEADEHFWCLFLDNRHRVIAHEVIAHGTIDSAAVYPRVIVRKSLQHNAAGVIFAHNHPSGVAEPSDTDVRLTRKLIDALALIDVRVLDHLIVGVSESTSLAERGLL